MAEQGDWQLWAEEACRRGGMIDVAHAREIAAISRDLVETGRPVRMSALRKTNRKLLESLDNLDDPELGLETAIHNTISAYWRAHHRENHLRVAAHARTRIIGFRVLPADEAGTCDAAKAVGDKVFQTSEYPDIPFKTCAVAHCRCVVSEVRRN